MNERKKILDIIASTPKRYNVIIQKDKELWKWILENSTTSLKDNVAAQIYSAVHGSNELCPNGKNRKFSSFNGGWKGCGRAATCKCTQDAVASAVSNKKKTRSSQDIENENKKRRATNLKKYGVENTGQIPEAKKAHVEFYTDTSKASAQLKKQKATMMLKYGVENIALHEPTQKKKFATCIEKYGAANPMKNSEISAKSAKNRANNYDPAVLFKNNFRKFVVSLRDNFGVEPLMTEDEYKGVATRPLIRFKCCDCGDEFDKRFDYGAVPICKICHPTEVRFESREEVAVREFIESIYSGPVKSRDRSLINPYELDIVLPEKRIAIEYCGLYWHSDRSQKSWKYHETKMKMAESKGYRLITIFSDEWLQKQDIVKSKLLAIIGGSEKGLGARKCDLRVVDYKDAKDFHDSFHIQGSPRKLGTSVGLYYQETLVALASFVLKGDKSELIRFSSSRQVIGGCSKIINFYKKNIADKTIVSFADLRWSKGDMYKSIGFVETGRVPPMQSYVLNYTDRFHKLAFKKNKINPHNLDKTEWQIMQENGYDRIWDCGKIKFELK